MAKIVSGRPPPKGRLYGSTVVAVAVGLKVRTQGGLGSALNAPIASRKLIPYAKIAGVYAFSPRQIAIWRGWPIDLTERLLEMAARVMVAEGMKRNHGQKTIDREVERWQTSTTDTR